MTRYLRQLICILSFLLITNVNSYACTRALWASNEGVVVARTMDWLGDMHSNLYVYPRGIARDGLADVNSLSWISKYGSIITSSFDAISSDGMNEKGFAAHIFWFIESDYGTRNPALPGMSVLMWEQFYLDNFATVDEAVEYTQSHPFQLEPFELDDPMALHLIISDASGDTAVFEYTNGQLHIYHDAALTVTANAPSIDKQLANLHLYKEFGGDKPVPGSTDSQDRFVRAAYNLKHLPPAKSPHDAIIKVLSVIDSTIKPYGEPGTENSSPSNTIWKTALDLTHRVYYFESSETRTLIWANLDEFNLNQGAPVLKLDVVNRTYLAGDVTKKFTREETYDTTARSRNSVKAKMLQVTRSR